MFKRILLFSFLLAVLSSCDSSNDPADNTVPTNSISFLSLYWGNDAGISAKQGMIKVTNTSAGPSFQFITEYYPEWNGEGCVPYMAYKNGLIAYCCKNNPQGKSPIAYMFQSNLSDVKFVPVPTAEAGYYYSVPRIRPQVTSSGKIIYQVTLETDNQYDDFHLGRFAIYDPKTGKIDLTDYVSDFIKNLPDKGPDTEGGSLGASFVLSQDDKYIYTEAYGYGTEGGQYHKDKSYILQYEIATNKIAKIRGGGTIHFVTYDGKYLVYNDANDYKKYSINIDTKSELLLDEYLDGISLGMYSTKDYSFFKLWRGSGMAIFNAASKNVFVSMLGDSLKYPYRGLGFGGQYSSDESKIYFAASADYLTNSAAEKVIYALNPKLGKIDTKPDSIMKLSKDVDTGLMLLLK